MSEEHAGQFFNVFFSVGKRIIFHNWITTLEITR